MVDSWVNFLPLRGDTCPLCPPPPPKYAFPDFQHPFADVQISRKSTPNTEIHTRTLLHLPQRRPNIQRVFQTDFKTECFYFEGPNPSRVSLFVRRVGIGQCEGAIGIGKSTKCKPLVDIDLFFTIVVCWMVEKNVKIRLCDPLQNYINIYLYTILGWVRIFVRFHCAYHTRYEFAPYRRYHYGTLSQNLFDGRRSIVRRSNVLAQTCQSVHMSSIVECERTCGVRFF